jgi:hypothetical protein
MTMDKIDLELIQQMSKQFNLFLTEFEESDHKLFDFNGYVQLQSPCDDTEGKWAVYKLHVKPGVHTMPNGDPGYPAEVDAEDVGSYDTCLQGLVEAVKLAVEIAAGDINADLGMFHDWKEEREGQLEQSFG